MEWLTLVAPSREAAAAVAAAAVGAGHPSAVAALAAGRAPLG